MPSVLMQIQCRCLRCHNFVVLQSEQIRGDTARVFFVPNDEKVLCPHCALEHKTNIANLDFVKQLIQHGRNVWEYQYRRAAFLKDVMQHRALPEQGFCTVMSSPFNDTSIPRGALVGYNENKAKDYYKWLKLLGFVE